MDIWEAALWFFVGAASFKAASYFLSIGYGYTVFRDVESIVLSMLLAANQDLIISFKMKHAALKKSGMEKEELERIILKDATILTAWRTASINKILLSIPKSYHKFVEYTNWEQAQEVFKQREGDL